jgi:hypothetical protein
MAVLPSALRQQVSRKFHRVPPPWGEGLANGGGGFLGLIDGVVDDLDANAVDLYESFMEPEDDPEAPAPWHWREGVLPILYWGCNTYSCVDCTDGTAPMIGRDGFRWVPDGRPLVRWLADWADDRLEQPADPGQRS